MSLPSTLCMIDECLKIYVTDRQTDRQKFFQKLSKHSLEGIGKSNAPEFIDYWRKRFSIQLQKCNAKLLLMKSSALCSDGVNKLVAYCTRSFSH